MFLPRIRLLGVCPVGAFFEWLNAQGIWLATATRRFSGICQKVISREVASRCMQMYATTYTHNSPPKTCAMFGGPHRVCGPGDIHLRQRLLPSYVHRCFARRTVKPLLMRLISLLRSMT